MGAFSAVRRSAAWLCSGLLLWLVLAVPAGDFCAFGPVPAAQEVLAQVATDEKEPNPPAGGDDLTEAQRDREERTGEMKQMSEAVRGVTSILPYVYYGLAAAVILLVVYWIVRSFRGRVQREEEF